jgi:two-component system LytT family response regulator
MKLKAMIVDDEPFARDDLRQMLACQKEVEVTCEAGTVAEAQKQLSENSLDVVFLDIQLRGGSGFDLVPIIDRSTDIIFITAFDEYAVRAFEINALDYILKPVSIDRLSASIERLKAEKAGQETPSTKTGPFEPDDSVFVKTDSGQLFVRIEEILAIASIGGNYTAIQLKNGENLLSRKTLKEWANVLPESVFFRIHRATIINLRHIERISNQKDGSCVVGLSGLEETFAVSRRSVAALKRLMGALQERGFKTSP